MEYNDLVNKVTALETDLNNVKNDVAKVVIDIEKLSTDINAFNIFGIISDTGEIKTDAVTVFNEIKNDVALLKDKVNGR